MARHKNFQWSVAPADNDGRHTWDSIRVSILLDIRDELQQMNRIWGCHNFQRIPQILDVIATDARRRDRLAKRKALLRRAATIERKRAAR